MSEPFKITVAYGTNLGVFGEIKEMSRDSFQVFNEILEIANKETDICIILGNLFQNPTPTSTTIASALSILNTQVAGQKVHNFTSQDCFDLNFGNKNLNISLPVFAIHGKND